LKGCFSKILIASFNGILCGFKVAYSRDEGSSLYSWMGGVLPEYRRKGIARNLSRIMEYLAIQNHFQMLSPL
jgi:ribosomal protein S18 acetylase RimI-like enzyme